MIIPQESLAAEDKDVCHEFCKKQLRASNGHEGGVSALPYLLKILLLQNFFSQKTENLLFSRRNFLR